VRVEDINFELIGQNQSVVAIGTFSDTYEIKRSEEPSGGLGINASESDMKHLTETALTDLVNEIIIDERFEDALR